jgi:hypothetical protein
MMTIREARLTVCVALVMVFTSLFAGTETASAASDVYTPNVKTHTQKEIIKYWLAHPFDTNQKVTYTVKPKTRVTFKDCVNLRTDI